MQVNMVLVYIMVWFAVVFGINSASNADGIVWGTTKHYYTFIPALRALLIQILQQTILLQINLTFPYCCQ